MCAVSALLTGGAEVLLIRLQVMTEEDPRKAKPPPHKSGAISPGWVWRARG